MHSLKLVRIRRNKRLSGFWKVHLNLLHHNHFDVVIVGAGPAGSSCAALLARDGARVLLCDKGKFPREKICGDCINPKCWEVFDLLGVSGDIASNSEVVKGVMIAGASGSMLSIALSPLDLQRSPLVAMKRSMLDSILVNRAIANGTWFFDETALESVDRSVGGEWSLSFRNAGEEGCVDVSADILVGADGRNSRVANLLAKDRKYTRINSMSNRIGVQFIVERPENLGSNVLMFFFDGGYGGVVGVSPKEANVGMVVTQDLARLATVDFEKFIHKSILSNTSIRAVNPVVKRIGEISSASPITPRTNHLRESKAYLIGDARRTTEPFTGEGVFYAMQDGLRIAGVISSFLGLKSSMKNLRPRSRFWVDSIFSPILRNGTLIEKLVILGATHRAMADFLARRVFEN